MFNGLPNCETYLAQDQTTHGPLFHNFFPLVGAAQVFSHSHSRDHF